MQKYLEDHQFYEQRLKLDKAAGSSLRKEEKEEISSDKEVKEDKYKKENRTESKFQDKHPPKKITRNRQKI